MSGIAGIIHFDGTPVESGLVEKMTSSMAYRGPDGIGYWHSCSVAFGQCMLRTTPESLEEVQPWSNEDENLTLVLDGRVDNWIELRNELLARGVVLRNHSDAELVLRSFELWEKECIAHIDGDFAFVIWNKEQRSAFCARDRLGNKPFYYYWNGKTLIFASELKAIVATGKVALKQNKGMLVEFLAGEWHSRDETLWLNIHRLVAAHKLLVSENSINISRYWQPDLYQALHFNNEQQYFDHYREILFKCVRRMSRSHRPVSIEVSGGLDSSSIFSIAEKLRREGALFTEQLDAYALRFDGNGPEQELEYSQLLGEHFQIDVKEVPASLLPLSWFENRGREYCDFPGYPNAAMFEGIRQESSIKGSRVTLTGEGGDQWLQGGENAYYLEELRNRNLPALIQCLRADVSGLGIKKTIWGFLRYGCFPLLPEAIQSTLKKARKSMTRPQDSRKFWLSDLARDTLTGRRETYATPPPKVRNFGQIELSKTLNDAFTDHVMENAERLAARHGVELRYPFRDPEFVQFAFSFPERFRLRGGRTKYIHLKALEGILPDHILRRRSKAEFSCAFRPKLIALSGLFLDKKAHETMGDNTDESLMLVDTEGLKNLYAAFLNDDQIGWPLWPLWSNWYANSLRDTTFNKRHMISKKNSGIIGGDFLTDLME